MLDDSSAELNDILKDNENEMLAEYINYSSILDFILYLENLNTCYKMNANAHTTQF